MEQFSEIPLSKNQVAFILVRIYKVNQKIAAMASQSSEEKTQKSYRDKEFSQEALLAATQATLHATELEKERKRQATMLQKTLQIGEAVQAEADLFNLDFLVWNYQEYPADTLRLQEQSARANALKVTYERVRGPQAIFEVQARLWHRQDQRELITSLSFFHDLTIHREQKLNLIFMMEDEKYWLKKFFAPLYAQRKMKAAKVRDITVMILDF
ncbi:MAG TPA: hypothetical protein PLB38_02235 [bacterium]|nr:hypothetical protein [bacterium]